MSQDSFSLKQRIHNGKKELWDAYRNKWIVVTPEEEVRQLIAFYLNKHLGYPKSWISIEKGIKHGNKVFRFDIVLNDSNSQPLVLVECKAPSIPINQKVFDQIFKYNTLLKVPYLLVSNGIDFYAVDATKEVPEYVSSLPPYKS